MDPFSDPSRTPQKAHPPTLDGLRDRPGLAVFQVITEEHSRSRNPHILSLSPCPKRGSGEKEKIWTHIESGPAKTPFFRPPKGSQKEGTLGALRQASEPLTHGQALSILFAAQRQLNRAGLDSAPYKGSSAGVPPSSQPLKMTPISRRPTPLYRHLTAAKQSVDRMPSGTTESPRHPGLCDSLRGEDPRRYQPLHVRCALAYHVLSGVTTQSRLGSADPHQDSLQSQRHYPIYLLRKSIIRATLVTITCEIYMSPPPHLKLDIQLQKRQEKFCDIKLQVTNKNVTSCRKVTIAIEIVDLKKSILCQVINFCDI